LTFVAAVILGCGANLQARGSVVGTFIAVFFLRFVSTNLIMLGIPSYWQRMVTGCILLVSLLAQVRGKRAPQAGKE
jgi:simple sugar transport system permease protein